MDRSGLFDRGSWTETLEGWAKTVVAGRATLGGIPCGVILVETRLTKKFNPADPADPTSASSFVTQAGQVWFPDSARKTADALDDFHHERLPCFILANWRGFSGGMRDMYDEVLKFGASIVDNLRVYTAPVFIYIPPFGELRGGAWVVVDPVINHNGAVEMYCDPTSRGGILEASGVAEIKFRDNDVRELIRRSNPELTSIDPKKAREEENNLLPRYRDVAVRFADLHDTYVRMKAVGVVRDVIPWKDSRRIFAGKLTRKLKELEVANDLVEAKVAPTLAEAVRFIQETFRTENPTGPAWGTDDKTHLQWLEEQRGKWETVKSEKEAAPEGSIRDFLASCQSPEDIKKCFAELFKDKQFAEAAAEVLQQEAGVSSTVFED
ncbi:acetyl-CoA carboxylase [Angomonas deanei]|uniref:Carboxyl transferase domain containing protein, putative n=1 Tax=Angomonas deanei TaxID=59799 RepID=A0A7G2C1R4_9TRYP|nr:acetyl-CoA carboxylase [Angomonas deanei]CAD2213485.1 Carboxyl transferase domain containing protein, putative [Angomonas deanei]|eukprot:EPY43311.1 acetyl-CoA carboxylase [Angomonas deanei]